MSLNEMKDVYLAIGIGGLSFLALLVILFYVIKSILPLLAQIKEYQLEAKEKQAVTEQIVSNNTEAVKEVAKSTQNVATALQILDKSMNSVHSDVLETKKITQNIEKTVMLIEDRTDIK